MPKKITTNGFNMFRLHMISQERKKGSGISEHEIMINCTKEWDLLNDDEKLEWKNQARAEKFKCRNASVTQTLSNLNLENESPGGAAAAAASSSASYQMENGEDAEDGENQQIPPSAISVRKLFPARAPFAESVLKANDEIELLHNLEKRRHRDRQKFADTFTWHYADEKDVLKSQKFYLFASTILHYTNEGDCIPAEIACVEFSINEGVTNEYCVPVKIPAESCSPEMQRRIADLSRKTHQFTANDLQIIGKSCNEIANDIIDMSLNGEPTCNVRYFVLHSEIQTTLSCLRYLHRNASLEDEYKNVTLNDLAAVDDLAYGLFKVFDVDYPKLLNPHHASAVDSIDFGFFSELIGGRRYRGAVCRVHESYDASALCCLSNLYLMTEIICTGVKLGTFDQHYLSRFVSSTNQSKQKYYNNNRTDLAPTLGQSSNSLTADNVDNDDDLDTLSCEMQVNDDEEDIVQILKQNSDDDNQDVEGQSSGIKNLVCSKIVLPNDAWWSVPESSRATEAPPTGALASLKTSHPATVLPATSSVAPKPPGGGDGRPVPEIYRSTSLSLSIGSPKPTTRAPPGGDREVPNPFQTPTVPRSLSVDTLSAPPGGDKISKNPVDVQATTAPPSGVPNLFQTVAPPGGVVRADLFPIGQPSITTSTTPPGGGGEPNPFRGATQTTVAPPSVHLGLFPIGREAAPPVGLGHSTPTQEILDATASVSTNQQAPLDRSCSLQDGSACFTAPPNDWSIFPSFHAPDTLSLQLLLPLNHRGFGRGIRLHPEAALFLQHMKELHTFSK